MHWEKYSHKDLLNFQTRQVDLQKQFGHSSAFILFLFIVIYTKDNFKIKARSTMLSLQIFRVLEDLNTAWKVFVFGVILVRIFPHLDWIRRDSSYFSEFSENARNSWTYRKKPQTSTFNAVKFSIENLWLQV